ncbi:MULTISPECIES: hypothetical protein [Acidobacteriaceae]|uniref:hypothetical protein n=1 Tax=Acidobacteriaceae TaxID=204434 RepID=UPI00131A8F8C|nr:MULTISPECIES: hypothetical protein [Acidobacteriaceae]MDW5265928.1 hypothetical protein [Edaphobacter sp.]
MLNSTTLEVAIGMALVFLLVSLLCTAVNEIIADFLGTRASTLEKGITSLFTEGTMQVQGKDGSTTLKPLVELLYEHGLIQSLYLSGSGQSLSVSSAKGSLPSYIPARTFASALFDLLFRSHDIPPSLEGMLQDLNALPDSRVKEALRTLVTEAQGDAVRTRRAFENWYNDAMDRVSGWYKQRTQRMLFAIGLTLAVVLNINAIGVARTLWSTPAARAYVTNAAQKYATQTPSPSAKEIRTDLGDLASVGLPLGWDAQHWPWEAFSINTEKKSTSEDFSLWLFSVTLFGWILTAIATSLGAPFWFDLLNQFMEVRSTIKPQEKSSTEGSKDAT